MGEGGREGSGLAGHTKLCSVFFLFSFRKKCVGYSCCLCDYIIPECPLRLCVFEVGICEMNITK